MPIEHLTPAAERRAIEVQLLLADEGPTGQHRTAPVPALLIAAIAELVGLAVLHDSDEFELISRVTVQPMQRLRLPERRPQSDVSIAHASASPVISRMRSTR
jgi:predicted nucleic acid-binding protein